jgi:hypothetical protein
MSCNSCSNVTLPGVVGPAGATGATGATGPSSTITIGSVTTGSPADVEDVGTPGAAVFNFTIPQGIQGLQGPAGVSVIEIDTVLGGGVTTQTSAVTAQKSFDIPANTWQNDGDMVELEIMAVGEFFDGAFPNIYHRIFVTLGEAPGTIYPIDMDSIFTYFFGNGYIGSQSRFEPFMHLRVQLSMSSTGTITPITDFYSSTGSYSDESTTLSGDRYISKQRGANLTGVPVSSDIPLKVYMVSPDASASAKLFYFKLTSYKA